MSDALHIMSAAPNKHLSIHTNRDGAKFMANKNPLHQLAHIQIIRMTNETQILYKMIRMHYVYTTAMLDDNGVAYVGVYVFLYSWVHFLFEHRSILCDIDTRALAFKLIGALHMVHYYMWYYVVCRLIMVMLSRSG